MAALGLAALCVTAEGGDTLPDRFQQTVPDLEVGHLLDHEPRLLDLLERPYDVDGVDLGIRGHGLARHRP